VDTRRLPRLRRAVGGLFVELSNRRMQ
jgi:hypothetical protein